LTAARSEQLQATCTACSRHKILTNSPEEHPTERLPNTLNVGFAGHFGSHVLDALECVAASTGSACHSGSRELSPVLRAMGVPADIGHGAVRFSLGRSTTKGQLDRVLALLRTRVLKR
jgi:cysteine desulfurase